MQNLTNVITKKVDGALGIFNKALDKLNSINLLIASRNLEIKYKMEDLQEEQDFLDKEKVRVRSAIKKIEEIVGG